MKRPIVLILANAVLLVAAFFMLGQLVFIANVPALAERVSGSVLVQRGGRGEFSPLARGASVQTGDVLRSEPDGSVELTWDGGTRLVLVPGSELVVVRGVRNGLRRSSSHHFRLVRGKLFVRLPRALKPTSTFEIETAHARAWVRGAVFSVATGAAQSEENQDNTRIAVYRGLVIVQSEEGEQPISQGRVARCSTRAAGNGNSIIALSHAGEAEFDREPSVSRPDLSIKVKRVGDTALLSGRTEIGDSLAINGRSVSVMGNGAWFQRVPLKPGINRWTFVATDRYNCTQTLSSTLTK